MVQPAATFYLYELVSVARGADVHRVPMRGQSLDLEALAAAAGEVEARIVWICDPNNPTGTALQQAEWDEFLTALPEGCVVVADEAYADYLAPERRVRRERDVEAGRPVVVLRSFSKFYGLAGLRLGYAVVDEALAAYLSVVEEPCNVNCAALAAGMASLRATEAAAAAARARSPRRATVLERGLREAGRRAATRRRRASCSRAWTWTTSCSRDEGRARRRPRSLRIGDRPARAPARDGRAGAADGARRPRARAGRSPRSGSDAIGARSLRLVVPAGARPGGPRAARRRRRGRPRLRGRATTSSRSLSFEPVTAEELERLPALRVVATPSVGFDHIDVAAATARGVWVCNVPDYCVEEMADHALALLLALVRGIVELDRSVAAGAGTTAAAGALRAYRDVRLGVIGFGRIGRAVAARALALGHGRVRARSARPDDEIAPRVSGPLRLDELLASSTAISLHAPLTAETRGLIGAAELALLPEGAFVVNAARAPLLDTRAALEALEAGRLGGVALDVLDVEPPDVGRDGALLASARRQSARRLVQRARRGDRVRADAEVGARRARRAHAGGAVNAPVHR